MPGISNLFLLKSIIRYRRLWPPPLRLMVILPVLFLPPLFLKALVSLFYGELTVNSEKSALVANLDPGVVGLSFLMPMTKTQPHHRQDQFYRFHEELQLPS